MEYQVLRNKLLDDIRSTMPEHLQRLSWSRDQVLAFQRSQLLHLLKHAKCNSPWHRERLAHVNPEQMTVQDLHTIPVMTKQDAMENWDDIVCDSQLSREIAQSHLAKLRDGGIENPYYQDQYLFFATGGSSGQRGLFVWDWDFFMTGACITFRYQHRDETRKPIVGRKKAAVLVAPSPLHASNPLFTINVDPSMEPHLISGDRPIDTICQRLNKLQPTHLIGYASVIEELSHEALFGKLKIEPQRISTDSEPLDEEARSSIRKAWGVEVNNMWGCVEVCVAAVESDAHCGMFLAEDVNVFETVDENLHPTEDQNKVRKLLATNLYNYTFPIIRYVIDDVLLVGESQKDTKGYRVIKEILGRADDWFIYNNLLRVHPMVFRHILGQEDEISEYQVEQTKQGAVIRIVSEQKIDTYKLTCQLKTSLQEVGLQNPIVDVQQVKSIPRHQETGKLKRFIPLKQH